jgi:hypothetical protein
MFCVDTGRNAMRFPSFTWVAGGSDVRCATDFDFLVGRFPPRRFFDLCAT